MTKPEPRAVPAPGGSQERRLPRVLQCLPQGRWLKLTHSSINVSSALVGWQTAFTRITFQSGCKLVCICSVSPFCYCLARWEGWA